MDQKGHLFSKKGGENYVLTSKESSGVREEVDYVINRGLLQENENENENGKRNAEASKANRAPWRSKTTLGNEERPLSLLNSELGFCAPLDYSCKCVLRKTVYYIRISAFKSWVFYAFGKNTHPNITKSTYMISSFSIEYKQSYMFSFYYYYYYYYY